MAATSSAPSRDLDRRRRCRRSCLRPPSARSRPETFEQARAEASIAESLARRTFLPGEEGRWIEDKRADLRETLVRALDCLAETHRLSGRSASRGPGSGGARRAGAVPGTRVPPVDGGTVGSRERRGSAPYVRALPSTARRRARNVPLVGDGGDLPPAARGAADSGGYRDRPRVARFAALARAATKEAQEPPAGRGKSRSRCRRRHRRRPAERRPECRAEDRHPRVSAVLSAPLRRLRVSRTPDRREPSARAWRTRDDDPDRQRDHHAARAPKVHGRGSYGRPSILRGSRTARRPSSTSVCAPPTRACTSATRA